MFGAELYSRIEIDDIVKHESCRDGSFRSDNNGCDILCKVVSMMSYSG